MTTTPITDPYDHLESSIHAVQQRFPGAVAEALEEARGILQSVHRTPADPWKSPALLEDASGRRYEHTSFHDDGVRYCVQLTGPSTVGSITMGGGHVPDCPAAEAQVDAAVFTEHVHNAQDATKFEAVQTILAVLVDSSLRVDAQGWADLAETVTAWAKDQRPF